VGQQGDWHPILAAVEGPTGTWHMVAPDGKQYGTIEIRRIMNGAEVRYRVVRRGEVIGWATTLRGACERIHRVYLDAHGPRGGPIADWGERTGRALRAAADQSPK
jgi:hypothetical protein